MTRLLMAMLVTLAWPLWALAAPGGDLIPKGEVSPARDHE